MPALLYYFIGGQVSTTLDTRGTQRSRVQFDCFADTYADAATLRNAVIDAIAGYTSFAFACQIISTRDSYDHELKQYIAVVEVYLTYSL